MEKITLAVQLTLEAKKGITAHLLFKNTFKEALSLNRFVICLDGRLYNKLFEVSTETGEEIPYKGFMSKMRFIEEDMFILQPGETIASTVRLTSLYRFEKGKKYCIQYACFNHQPETKRNPVYLEMISNTAAIVYE